MEKGGYHVAVNHEGGYVEDFPYGHPYIIEIMTSSTSVETKRRVQPYRWHLEMPFLATS